jgi:hypothetical protein
MYHVNAENLPGNEVSRTFEGGKHGPPGTMTQPGRTVSLP